MFKKLKRKKQLKKMLLNVKEGKLLCENYECHKCNIDTLVCSVIFHCTNPCQQIEMLEKMLLK